MNGTEKSRIDLWLFIAAVAALFRVTTFLIGILVSTLGVLLSYVPYEFVRPVTAALPVLGPVAAVILAVLIACAVETRLTQAKGGRKKILLAVLIVLALLPWQLQIKTTAQPVMWDEVPEHMKQEMGLQQQGGEYSSPATRSTQPTP